MTEALLFDFNGVITDDEEQHRAAFAELLAEAGIPLTREQYYADYLGCDDRSAFIEAYRRAGQPLDPGRLDALVARKSQAYARLIGTTPALVPGAAAFVRAAAARFRLGLVSGAQRREIEPALAGAGLADCFAVIVAAEDVPRCKPDPVGYLTARAALGRGAPLPVERCVVLEDSLAGLAAARAAGMRCVMLTTSHGAAELHAADLVWTSFVGHDPAELLALAAGAP
jgi:HAD superfamily hydrolase (TIGR01509 family)